MHEFSIAEEMLQIIERALGCRSELARINIVIGPLSGVSADSLRFCLGEMARESGFGTPDLSISQPPAWLTCRSCGIRYGSDDFYSGCPACGSMDRTVLSGRECTVESVEIMDDPPPI